MKREADFTRVFQKWAKASNAILTPTAFELKQTTTESIPFSAVKDHQLAALEAVASNQGFIYKISDGSAGFKPFDLFYMRQCMAFVVIKYPREFFLINVFSFKEEKKSSKRRSLTRERAREISVFRSAV